MQWFKTKYPGIRYRQHSTRKHGIQPDRYYVLTYKHDGKTRTEALGWASEGMNLEKAVEAMAEIKANRRAGTGPETLTEKRRLMLERKAAEQAEKDRLEAERKAAEQAEAERQRQEQEGRFVNVFAMYLESGNYKKSLRGEETIIRIWAMPIIGQKHLKEITPFDLERIRSKMIREGRAIRSVQYLLAVIRQVFNFAIGRGLFTGQVPTKAVKVKLPDNRRTRILSATEAERLLQALQERSLTVYRMALLSLHSAMRLGEITGLTWQCVSIENRQLLLLDTKNGTSRTVFMTDTVARMFSEMERGEPSELVFPSKTKSQIAFLSKTFGRVIDDLGLNAGVTDRRMKLVFHSLRHSCASHLAMSRVDLQTIQNILGHKTLAMTSRYSHLTNGHIQEAIGKLDGVFAPKQEKVVALKRAG